MFNIKLIENAWPVVKASLVARLGAFLGAYGAILAACQAFLSQADQATLHVPWQVEHLPFILAVAGILGIPVARVVKQDSVTNAANK
jgi:hypothetical protein